MTINDKILNFITEMDYLNNEHVLGVLFYGSYLTGLSNLKSDIDLHIIFDSTNPDHLIRGNKIIDGTRIEYFEKSINDIYLTIENDYENQNNASLAIFGKSKIIYEKDNELTTLQQYVVEKFREPLPPLDDDSAKELVSIINNRMERLEKYAQEDNPYFEHLYHLTIDKIRRFYHSLIGIPKMETSKCFKLYTDPKYKEAFCFTKLPPQHFIDLYFEAITNKYLDKRKKYELVDRLYNFTKQNVLLDQNNYRIHFKSRNIGFDMDIQEVETINKNIGITIPNTVLKKVLKFIKEMDYLNNDSCLGAFVYGSSLTGFNTTSSDIDLHVIFKNQEPPHLIRGCRIIDDTKIEYFEKSIKDVYLSVENGYSNQDNAFFSMIGKGSIVFQRDNKLSELQQYTLNRFKTPMPSLDEDDAKEQVSIINNRMEKLESYATKDSPYFEHLYHLAISRIRKAYHQISGISKIQTSKVYRIYTDKEYRESMYKENPEEEFVSMYIDLITTNSTDKLEKLQMIQDYYNYATRNITLGDEYRILIKSRNPKKNITSN